MSTSPLHEDPSEVQGASWTPLYGNILGISNQVEILVQTQDMARLQLLAGL